MLFFNTIDKIIDKFFLKDQSEEKSEEKSEEVLEGIDNPIILALLKKFKDKKYDEFVYVDSFFYHLNSKIHIDIGKKMVCYDFWTNEILLSSKEKEIFWPQAEKFCSELRIYEDRKKVERILKKLT